MNSNERKKNISNKSFSKSKVLKNDEFFTLYEDIEKELEIYGKMGLFKNKKIILPCDLNSNTAKSDIEKAKSNFHKYLYKKKNEFGIESITTSYWDGTISDEENIKRRNKKFQDVNYENYDIVITNPPFSLFREFIDVMFREKMKFIVLGNIGSICYKNIFPRFKNNEIWTGHSGAGHEYETLVTDNNELNNSLERKKLGLTCWFTNMDHGLRSKQNITLKNIYHGNEHEYHKYDHQNNIININHNNAIPKDYDKVMGVPLTFIVKHNPEQFEIVGISEKYDKGQVYINGKKLYGRLFIKRKNYSSNNIDDNSIHGEIMEIIGSDLEKLKNEISNKDAISEIEIYSKISQLILKFESEIKSAGWSGEGDLLQLEYEVSEYLIPKKENED